MPVKVHIGSLRPTDETCRDTSIKSIQGIPLQEGMFSGKLYINGHMDVFADSYYDSMKRGYLSEWCEDHLEHRFGLEWGSGSNVRRISGYVERSAFRIVFEDEGDASLFYIAFK